MLRPGSAGPGFLLDRPGNSSGSTGWSSCSPSSGRTSMTSPSHYPDGVGRIRHDRSKSASRLACFKTGPARRFLARDRRYEAGRGVEITRGLDGQVPPGGRSPGFALKSAGFLRYSGLRQFRLRAALPPERAVVYERFTSAVRQFNRDLAWKIE